MDTNPWEDAYLRFESADEEIEKFVARLTKLGAKRWPRDFQIVELFSGRGSGLHALERLGFHNIEGIDLSPRLVQQYRGRGRCYVGDCCALPFPDRSKDVLIVQGGLHHLVTLPDDLDRVFAEMNRVRRKGGQVVIVEPWLTPFLRMVHHICEWPPARAASGKLDALATMIENERATYQQWLGQPELVRGLARKHFAPVLESCSFGKWYFVGQ